MNTPSIPRVTINAKPEHFRVAASFADRALSPEFEWPRAGVAEMRVEGYGPPFFLVAKRLRTGLSVSGRDAWLPQTKR